MANIAALLSNLGGGNQQGPAVDPFAQLLQSRGATPPPFSSSIQPMDMPNVIQAQAQAQDQSGDFYGMLNSISDRINSNRQAAEDAIAQNAQKAHEEALMRKIQSMIPQPSYGGGGGSSYINTGGINGNPGGGGGGSSSIFPSLPGAGGGFHLPDISGNNPVVATPPDIGRQHMCSVRPDLC